MLHISRKRFLFPEEVKAILWRLFGYPTHTKILYLILPKQDNENSSFTEYRKFFIPKMNCFFWNDIKLMFNLFY